jgi:hypothetical protein
MKPTSKSSEAIDTRFEMHWRQLYERAHNKLEHYRKAKGSPITEEQLNAALYYLQPLIIDTFNRVANGHEEHSKELRR